MPKQELYTLFAGIITAIPIFHLWLHALLPFWKKHPYLFYVLVGSVFLISTIISFLLFPPAYYLFVPTFFMELIGWTLMAGGLILVTAAIATIRPERFFVWAVLFPQKVYQKKILKGPYKYIPHPAYIGWIIIAMGTLLAGGLSHLLIPIASMTILIPIVIILEEKELNERTE